MATATSNPPSQQQQQHRKRSVNSNDTATEGESKRSKFDDLVVDDDANDSSFSLLDLHRLIHVMETDPSPSYTSWRDIHRRADLCQQMFVALVGLNGGADVGLRSADVQRLKERVDVVCLRAVDVAVELKTRQERNPGECGASITVATAGDGTTRPSIRDPVREIFFSSRANGAAISTTAAESATAVEKILLPTVAPVNELAMKGEQFEIKAKPNGRLHTIAGAGAGAGASAVAAPTDDAVADLQELQREQMEEAVSAMAAQLKQHTSQIHSQLKGQTEHLLDEMETVAEQNVEAVTDVAAATQKHVQKGWRRSVATWTLLVTIGAAFVATVLTIATIPKRQGGGAPCVGWLCPPKPRADQFCRTLVNGKVECVDTSPTTTQDVDDRSKKNSVPDDKQYEPHESDDDDDLVDDGHYEEEDEDITEYEEEEDEEMHDEELGEDQEAVVTGGAPSPFSYRDAALAASQGQLTQLENALKQDPTLAMAMDPNGWSLLHESARFGHTKVVQFLLDVGCDPHMIGDAGTTALDVARHLGNDHQTVVILRHRMGLSVAQDCEVGPDGECIGESNAQPVATQEATASPRKDDSSRDDSGSSDSPTFDGRPFTYTELLRAVTRSDIRRLRGYMESRPSFLNDADRNGWTVLHLAARGGNAEVVELLLHGGCQVHLTNTAGQTAADVALVYHGSESALVQIFRAFMT